VDPSGEDETIFPGAVPFVALRATAREMESRFWTGRDSGEVQPERKEMEEGGEEVGAADEVVGKVEVVGAAEVMAVKVVVGMTMAWEVVVGVEVEEVVEEATRGRTLAVAVDEAELCLWMHTALFLLTFNSPFWLSS